MKKIFIIILCLSLCAAAVPPASAYVDTPVDDHATAANLCKIEIISYRQTLYKDKESEDFLWETLNKYSPTPELTAAIMGFFWRESYYKSNAIAHWANMDCSNGKDNSTEFTDKVDAGLADGSTREYFIDQVHSHIGGYGLGQWHAKSYLQAFYDFAQDWGTSIADAEMQCAFTVWSIYNIHTQYLNELDDSSFFKASQWMGYIYDGSAAAADTIYAKAKMVYKEKNAE